MDKVIVIYVDTIDDTDIEISGFRIMTVNDYDEYEKLAESITWPFTYQLGDYEITFNSGDDLLSRLEVRDIYIDEEKTLKKLLTGHGNEFGIFLNDSFLKDVYGDEEDDDGYDDYKEDDDDYDDDYGYDDEY